MLLLGASALGCISRPKPLNPVIYAPAPQNALAKSFQPCRGKALVYIYRSSQRLGGVPLRSQILVDGQPMAFTRPASFVELALMPGKHKLVSRTESIHTFPEMGPFTALPKFDVLLSVELEPGKCYFFNNATVEGDGFQRRLDLRAVPEDEGRAEVRLKGCRLVPLLP